MKTKKCTCCQNEFPATKEYFYPHARSKDGLYQQCKTCSRSKSSQWYQENSEKVHSEERLTYFRERYQRIKAKRPPKKLNIIDNLADTELAYIAGLIDGEGSFYIGYHKQSNAYIPSLSITMTHKETIDWLRQKLGSDYRYMDRKSNPTWKTQYLTRINGQRAIYLCKRLLPYLITKQEQAQVFIDFEVTYKRDEHGKAIPQMVTLRQELQQKVKSLNRPHVYNSEPANTYHPCGW